MKQSIVNGQSSIDGGREKTPTTKRAKVKSIISRSLEETEAIGKQLVDRLQPGAVVALVGELGSGKTTLVRGMAKALGVTEPVRSPTYVLLRVYQLANGSIPLGDTTSGEGVRIFTPEVEEMTRSSTPAGKTPGVWDPLTPGVEEAGVFPRVFPRGSVFRSGIRQLVHADLYRIEEARELPEELVELIERGDGIVVIEWPEGLRARLPDRTIWVTLKHHDATSRAISIDD